MTNLQRALSGSLSMDDLSLSSPHLHPPPGPAWRAFHRNGQRHVVSATDTPVTDNCGPQRRRHLPTVVRLTVFSVCAITTDKRRAEGREQPGRFADGNERLQKADLRIQFLRRCERRPRSRPPTRPGPSPGAKSPGKIFCCLPDTWRKTLPSLVRMRRMWTTGGA